MAYLAMRGSGAVNGVSRLHGQVSRRLFRVLFPRWPEAEVPVTHVTNGVHMPTWDSAEADRIWEEACGKSRWHDGAENLEADFRRVSDAALWQMRTAARKSLVEYVRKIHVRQLAGRGAAADEIAQAATVLELGALTLGFARRFAPYKRPNLLLQDAQRLVGILTNTKRQVQLVLAGKAHPYDRLGEDMIRQWIEFVHRPEVRSRVVFLSDYDALMAERLVQGVDVWVNTPRRPWEASGTSGMKVLVNGGLNVSELDGWWAEAYSPDVGWAIGDGREHDGDPGWDATEAEALYGLLEREIIPEFYRRDADGIPREWIHRVRESMARLTPAFSANRAVREYTDDYYVAAAAEFRERAANGDSLGTSLLKWWAELSSHWATLRFGSATFERRGEDHFFKVQVFLGKLDPEAVSAELYADGQNGGAPTLRAMKQSERVAESEDSFVYTAQIPATRPASDFTPRLVGYHDAASVPLEAPFILWHDSPSWRA
jgi:glycogen phosphorylase